MLDTLFAPGGRTGQHGFWTALPALGILYQFAGIALLIVGDGIFLWPPRWLAVGFGLLTAAFLAIGAIVGIRRLHDRDESGWWVLLAFIPVLGQIWYLGWNGARAGSGSANRFDADTAAIGAVFDDAAPLALRRRGPRASMVLAIAMWIGLLLTTGVTILLFRQPTP